MSPGKSQPSNIKNPEPDRSGLPPTLIFLLALAVGVGLFVAQGDHSAAYGLRNLATSSPISPMPEPDPQITTIDPKQGINTTVISLNVYGRHFKPTAQLFMRYAADQSGMGGRINTEPIPIRTSYVNSGQLLGRVPVKVNDAPLPPGIYDIVVVVGNKSATLPRAYRVVAPAQVDDLYAEPYNLWTDPTSLTVGQTAQIGLKVQRMGGQAGTGPFRVDFYYDALEAGNFIGSGMVMGVSPNDAASSSTVAWTPTRRGEVKLIAVIDAGGAVNESDESNNIVTRTMHVRQQMVADTYPPVASNLRVNGSAAPSVQVEQTAVTLQGSLVDGADPNNPNAVISGPSRVYYAELHWSPRAAQGAGSWVPVKWTEWLGYSSLAHAYELHPTPGVRYIQMWGADVAGNISAQPALRRVNYVPNEDEVDQGEVRVYRQDVAASRCLSVRVEPLGAQMDPDLYVWAPDGSLADFSINGAGQVDAVQIQPTMAGTYQIEVEGYTAASYKLTIEVSSQCVTGRVGESQDAVSQKAVRSAPAIPVDNQPEETDENIAPPQQELIQFLIFLSSLGRETRSQVSFDLFIPSVNR